MKSWASIGPPAKRHFNGVRCRADSSPFYLRIGHMSEYSLGVYEI